MKDRDPKGLHRSASRIQVKGLCRESGKKQFAFPDADKIAVGYRRAHDTRHHAYKCEACHGFHVGSSYGSRRPKSGRHPRINRLNGWGGANV